MSLMDWTVETEDGVTVYRRGDVSTLFACVNTKCGLPFVSRSSKQRTCGKAACREAIRRVTPKRRAACKARSHAWYERNKLRHAAKNRALRASARAAEGAAACPWLRGAPLYGSHLPGGGCEIHVSPDRRLEHRHIRGLHALLTALINEPHDVIVPGFSLMPWPAGCGWGVYFRDPQHLKLLAGRVFDARLFDARVEVRFSPARRLRAPALPSRGRGLVRIDAITPVCIRENGRGARQTYASPTPSCLLSALTVAFPRRLGLDAPDIGPAMLEIVENVTQPAAVQLSGKFKTIRGWTGHVVVEANAVTRWLLACAGIIGLGGRTALGFGRVRVTPC